MFRLNQHLEPHPDVVDTALDDGETVLLHMGQSTYFTLNATGTRIWEGLKQGQALSEISTALQQQYEIETDHANRSVLALVTELAQHELVRRPAE